MREFFKSSLDSTADNTFAQGCSVSSVTKAQQ